MTTIGYTGKLSSLWAGFFLLMALLSGTQVKSADTTTGTANSPRLILQITVDALRGDLPTRYAHVLGEGGFRYLMDQGVNYTNAHYHHANTETIGDPLIEVIGN
jgi:hypothetical protein